MEAAFTLIGTGNTQKLLYNYQPVTPEVLKAAGYQVKKSAANGGKGEFCYTCAPKGTDLLRIWYEATIICNGVLGAVWFCSHCSTAYEHRSRGKALWTELLKSFKIADRPISFNNPSEGENDYIPTREDFESAYANCARCGEAVSVDVVLNAIDAANKSCGRTLHPRWRLITEKNIEIWAGE